MRILHLAYEDFRAPGSGGGSLRTREIDTRLARNHEITAIVSSYPGARERVEEGVRWIPVGGRLNGRAARLAYFAALRRAVARTPHDLLVEDFGAPFSAGLAPLFTDRPVVASVQWLFAREMRAKYKLPFDWVERGALPLYNRFVAISSWLGDELRRRVPAAHITCIPEGVEQAAFACAPRPPQHLLFLGRLDVAQKGIDLLLEAYRRAGPERLPPLVIAGDGPDEQAIRRLVVRQGLADHVDLRGRLGGEAKLEAIAAAQAVLMPSRWETFGIVAAEALAVGVPLVAFDVGPLREVTGGHARLVEPFDVDAFAAAIVAAGSDREAGRTVRRNWASRFDWDAIAAQQEAVYLEAVA